MNKHVIKQKHKKIAQEASEFAILYPFEEQEIKTIHLMQQGMYADQLSTCTFYPSKE